MNPISTTTPISRTISAWVLSLLLMFSGGLMGMVKPPLSDPAYARKVLKIKGDVQQGSAIFQMNCAVCHGTQGNGNVGPSLKSVSDHKSRQGLIEQVIGGKTPPMPQFQPTVQEMADLLSYLEQL